MKTVCPYCRKELEVMELLDDNDALAAIRMLNTFGRHANLVCAYTELFGIRPLRAKGMKKWRVLLEEMKRLFDSESFTYQKRAYRISQAGIVEALNVVVHRNFADGLDSHNYLKKIMIGISEREFQEKSRQGEKDLRRREEALMAGNRPERATYQDIKDTWDYVEQKARARKYPTADETVQLPRMKEVPPARLTEEQIEENRRRLREMIKQIGG